MPDKKEREGGIVIAPDDYPPEQSPLKQLDQALGNREEQIRDLNAALDQAGDVSDLERLLGIPPKGR